MATIKIIDSYALITFLENGTGADFIRDLFLKAEEGSIKLAITSVNLGEVWSAIARATSPDLADETIKKINGMEIEIVDVDWILARQASFYKSITSITYTNCLAASLTKIRKGELITGDSNFKHIENEIRITYIN